MTEHLDFHFIQIGNHFIVNLVQNGIQGKKNVFQIINLQSLDPPHNIPCVLLDLDGVQEVKNVFEELEEDVEED